MQPQDTIIEVT